MLLISPDASYLERCKEEIGRELAAIGFEFNQKKTRVYPLTEGIMFLGFRFFLTETGKVLMQIDPQNVKSEQRKLRRLVALAKRGERTRERVDASYQAWRQHASKGNNWKLLQRMDKYYINLWKGVDKNEDHETGTVPGPASGA